MRKSLLFFVVLWALFVNTNFGYYLGLPNLVFMAYSPLLFFGLTLRHNYRGVKNTSSISILILSIFVIIVKAIWGQDFVRESLTFLAIPALLTIVLRRLTPSDTKILQHAVIVFFLIECLLAMYERATLNTFFYIEGSYDNSDNIEDWSFRASSLFGHPIANTMIIATFIVFVSCSCLGTLLKYSLVFIGIASILCFNVRGALLMSLVVACYIYVKDNSFKGRNKIVSYLFISVCLLLLVYILTQTSLGGRLMNYYDANGLEDSSTLARFAILSFMNFIDFQTLLTGDMDLMEVVMAKMGLVGVENGFIAIVLLYGLLLSIPIFFFLFVDVLKKLSVYPTYKKTAIMICFFGIGATNPHLADSTQWCIFTFLYYAFSPFPSSSYEK